MTSFYSDLLRSLESQVEFRQNEKTLLCPFCYRVAALTDVLYFDGYYFLPYHTVSLSCFQGYAKTYTTPKETQMKAKKVLILSMLCTALVAGNGVLNSSEQSVETPVLISGNTPGGLPIDPMTLMDKIKLVLNA